MVNINAFIAALKTTWLRKIITDNNSPWSIILQSMTDTKNVFNLGTHFITEKILPKIKNKFWKDVFSSHIQIVTKNTPTKIQQFQTIPIFSNENIKIGDKTVYYKSCFENGIKFINDLTNNDGSIYKYEELKATYNVTINFLQYSGLVRSILAWKKTLSLANIQHKEINPIIPFSFQIYLKNKKGAQDMYNLLNKITDIPSGKISWNKKYKFEDEEWGKIFSDPFKITKDSTDQWFQSRINHKILATNTYLYKIKLIGDPKCTFCNKTDETIEHLLWECEHVKSFLNETISWLIQHGIYITLNEKSFIFGKIQIRKVILIN